MPHSSLLLPPDYRRHVARDLVAFFHSLGRFGVASNRFDLRADAYRSFLENLLLGSLGFGVAVFAVLCVLVVRRTILHVHLRRRRRSDAADTTSTELVAVALLSVLALSALGGLLGEAHVKYSASVVLETMTNASDLFHDARELTQQSSHASDALRVTADNLITSFNETEVPAAAFELSIEALRLVHASKDLWNQSDAMLPTDFSDMASDWEASYFLLEASTNGAILAVVLASFLSIASVGWAMVSPLRLSILVILSVVPISHTLVGAYLSSTVMVADFCAAPMNSTLELVGATPVASYYIECPGNASLPFADAVASVRETGGKAAAIQQELERRASRQGDVGRRMKKEFLDPIGDQLEHVDDLLNEFVALQACTNTSSAFAYAATTLCEYGMLGFFSMWVHQLLLCQILVACVVVSVLVYERVCAREVCLDDRRYHLVSSYEEDGMEHVYLSPE
ncbi:unnamed protein product [Hyaloperonospora brassicae]|uniref:Uncharacterized protein n=1 Tax=Hyaloperonospora brassicae TaxID=162125 RepID=A0AAV0T3V0_HYABA|nr:unnamed protein product [Hyaloperonospora brassicae]